MTIDIFFFSSLLSMHRGPKLPGTLGSCWNFLGHIESRTIKAFFGSLELTLCCFGDDFLVPCQNLRLELSWPWRLGVLSSKLLVLFLNWHWWTRDESRYDRNPVEFGEPKENRFWSIQCQPGWAKSRPCGHWFQRSHASLLLDASFWKLACLYRGAAEEIGKMMDLREILLNRHQRLAYFWSWAAGGLNGLSGGPLSCDRWITWEIGTCRNELPWINWGAISIMWSSLLLREVDLTDVLRRSYWTELLLVDRTCGSELPLFILDQVGTARIMKSGSTAILYAVRELTSDIRVGPLHLTNICVNAAK